MAAGDSSSAASTSVGLLSHAEDQTDEDFFDKLIDDEFETTHTDTSHSDNAGGLPVDSEDVREDHLDPLIESQKADQTSSLTPEMDILEERSMVMETAKPFAFENVVPNDDTQSAKAEAEIIGDSSNSSATVNISKVDSTGIKEVQWSAFTSRAGEHQQLGGFGSFSDFLTDNSTGFSEIATTNLDSSGRIDGNTITDPSTASWFGSLEQEQQYGSEVQGVNGISEQDGQQPLYSNSSHEQDGQVSLDANDPLYWEKLYPGWKYDFSTGQWYQVDTDAGDSSSNDQLDGSVVNSEASFQAKTESASAYGNAQADSYNSSSNLSTEYPANMVFDPQYPGWYYDTNTQQWQTLESYAQMMLTETAMVVQNKLTSGNSGTSDSYFLEQKYSLNCNDISQFDNHSLHDQTHKEVLGEDLSRSLNNNYPQRTWQPQAVDDGHVSSLHGNNNEATPATLQGFIPGQNMYQYNLQPKVEQSQQHEDTSHSYYGDQNPTNHSQQSFQSGNLSHSQMSYTPMEGLSSAGRPLHALVTFGFGGKLVIMKNTSFGTSLNTFGKQDGCGGTISILNLMDVVMEKTGSSGIVLNGVDYFNSLCKQSFPGPLVGGNAASKDLNKWIDARIAACEISSLDFRKQQLLRLLLSVLKISHQYYGKLRSPFGTDPSSLENDGPESAVTNIFASSRKENTHMSEYGALTNFMHNFPTEGQIQAIAAEVQTLLVSGKRKEALQCAQEGMLWGPALVLAAQIGEKFYIDTVKQMAHRQFISGSPLRTLCLLIAGQPADVFSDDSLSSSFSNKVNLPQQSGQPLANGMLDGWEENLAVICANRTKDDELVIVHLGDCLWKERGETAAAHTCYLVAEANFESYSDTARLCLVGADHWNCPRTYATPEAIQWTEFYEYTKVLGNSQFQLLTFQPYKIIYAHMLAEVGKVSDSLRYCQTISKLLKNLGRSAEVEMWKLAASSLEERLRLHQQGGYDTGLAPAKLVGKFFTSIDKSIHRMIGTPPLPPLPPMPENKAQQHNEYNNFSMPPKVNGSQSTMAMSTLMPSASVETITDRTGDNKSNIYNRSVSEPDFGRSPKQSQPSDAESSDVKIKASSSRFGSFGSIVFQKTLGWVSRVRPDKQAKLGEDNKFYYDENLKRWLEKGVEPPPEEVAPSPPPIMASFQNGRSDYNINSALKTQNSLPDEMEEKPPMSLHHNSSIPPIPPSQNQFSARGRMGVRSRYVDTFNKGEGRVTGSSSFLAPANQSVKPIIGANFFVPTPLTSTSATAENATQNIRGTSSSGDLSSMLADTPSVVDASNSSHYPPLASYSMQRFSSMDTITHLRNNSLTTIPSRAASWSGSISDPPGSYTSVDKHHQSSLSMSPDSPRTKQISEFSQKPRDISQINSGGFVDNLQEVNL